MKFWLWGKCLRILLLQKLFSHSWLEKENDWSKEGKLSRISNWFRKGFTDQQVLFVKQFEFACNSKTTSSFQTEMGKGIKSGWYLRNFKVLLKSEWLASNFTNPRDSESALLPKERLYLLLVLLCGQYCALCSAYLNMFFIFLEFFKNGHVNLSQIHLWKDAVKHTRAEFHLRGNGCFPLVVQNLEQTVFPGSSGRH